VNQIFFLIFAAGENIYSKMKKILGVIIFLSITYTLQAQVTIGQQTEAAKGALLDIKEFEPDSENATTTKGFTLPRVELENKYSLSPIASVSSKKSDYTGMTVYNLSEITATNSQNSLKKGINIWDGDKWVYMGNESSPAFFYMPPFNLPLGNLQEVKSVDLYTEFTKRFPQNKADPTSENPLYVTSEKDETIPPGFYKRNELHYVVTGYSDEITVISVDNNGVMSYKTNSLTASDNSFINIILVVK